MSGNAWIQHVQLYRKKHPKLSYKEAMTAARASYKKKANHVGGGHKCEGCKYDSPAQRDHMGPGGCMANNSNSNNNSHKNHNNSNQCEGCLYDSPAQRDHMGPGGCMENVKKTGGNIDLRNVQMRFEAGVSPLNSNLADIGRRIIY